MKINTKTLILILLIVILSVAMVSCERGTPQPPPLPEDVSGSGSPVIRVNKNDMFVKIREGMLIGEERLEESEETFVSTEYTINTGEINYTVVYKANYAERRQNSEIYLKIFDNNENMNRIFVYYNKGDLFMQTMGNKRGVEGFGSTNMFDLFYEVVTMFDMTETFIGKEMSALFDPENVGASLFPLVDQSRMSYIMVTDTSESIEMTNVDLNYGQIKQQINDLIKNTFEKFEDKFDLLSLKYFGFRISELTHMEITTMKGDLINVKLKNQGVDSVIFEASGTIDDTINDTFTLEMEVQAREGSGDINIDDTENPYMQNYPEMEMGRYNYGGTLYVPFFDMEYDATLRTILSSTDNTVNEVMFNIESTEEDMGGLYYKDQMLYIDISGMQNQLGGAVELPKLNLPKIKFDNIDLAQEITLLFNDLLRLVRTMTEEDIYGENEELLLTVLDHIESDEENDTIYINITKELIEKMYGEDMDLVQIIADKLDVPREMVTQLLGDEALENAVLIFSYNVENGDIGLDLYDGDMLIFELRMSIIDPLPGDTLQFPPSFDPDTYYYLNMPDNTILTLEGELSMQEVSSVSFDKLFGALFGDVTGANTPYTLQSYEKLNFVLDIMQIYEYEEDEFGQVERTIEQVMKFELFKEEVLQLGVYSAEDPEYLLVDFNFPVGPNGRDRNGEPYQKSPLRYRIKRAKVVEAFNELLGDDNIFALENVMDILNRLISSLRESPSMQLRFFDNSLAFNLVADTVNELIGIENLNALMKARIRFATTAEEYLNINIGESSFVTPNVRPLDNETFESIYTTQWQEFVYTYFGDKLMRLKLTYLEDTVAIETGKYFYQPIAKILDTTVSYYVTIEDLVNGIKIVKSALDPQTPNNQDAVLTVDRPLKIDPSITNELDDKIPVLYDDNTFGYVDYIIEGFDVSNINISGMPREEFWLVIGKDSVAEKRFYISVEVLGRVIIPLQEIIMGESVPMISDKGNPVVDEVTIDPYTFAVRKAEDSDWSPLPSTINLNFESVDGVEAGDTIVMSDIDWDYDLDSIRFNGGVFFSHAMYNNLTIAIKINIKSKIVSYLRFVDSVNTDLPIEQRPYTEEIGLYTVDVLQTNSYDFPVQSTETQELRLYFEDGTYRIIAPRDYSSNPTDYYNNYLPITLNWKHPEIDPAAVRIQGTQAPLGLEDRNINTTVIEHDSFTVGTQSTDLRIIMPSRALGTIGIAGNVYAINGYQTLGDGSLNFEDPIKQMTSYHNVAFSKDAEMGEFYNFNPYNQKPLPNTVYMNVIQGGENRVQKKAYDIKWQESDIIMARHTYDGSGNIINTEYVLRNVSTYEEHLLVKGVIGDGDVSIEVNMIVRNIDAVYQDITFEGMDTNVTQMTVDPYLSYSLPSYYTLILKNGNQILVDDVEWYIVLEEGQEWMMQLDGRNYQWIYEYLRVLDEGMEDPLDTVPQGFDEPSEDDIAYFRLLIEKGEIPIDSRYEFTHEGGSFTIKSYIEATETIIAQEVYLTINTIPRTLIITDQMNEYTQVDIHNTSSSQAAEQYSVNTYTPSSSTMLERLILLSRLNDRYDNTIEKINLTLTALRKANPELDTEMIYSLCYDEYYDITTASERSILTQRYNYFATQNPTATEDQNKYNALQSYMTIKSEEIAEARVGIYFGDNPETSGQKYQLNVKWTNLEEIIATLESSDGAVLGITLEGYIGYGKVNQQKIKIPFYITRREITNFNFNRMTDYDPSVMDVDYRYVYISDEEEATELIYNIIAQNELYYDAYQALYNHTTTTDADRLIMEEIEQEIYDDNEEIRYELILNELIDRRLQNIRTIFIDIDKPLGLTQLNENEERIFIAPSEYFYNTLSQVSLMFADDEEGGYYNPRFEIGDGSNLTEQKNNFDAKILATDPEIYDVRIDEETQKRYAYVDLELTHLSAGSCRYPVTVRFKAIVDQINVVYGEPSQEEIEPFDEHGNARFGQGYDLPDSITVNYTYSGNVTFGNIYNWTIASPIPGFQEGQKISNIPITGINVLNPATMNFVIDLPCEQGEFTYNVAFPKKYIGKTMYNATAPDRDFQMLDIENGIIEIDDIYDIYDPSKSLGFDTSKLPQTINPFSYGFGEVQFDIGSMVIDTAYDTTLNNSFDVQWRIVDEWTGGRSIDYRGTTVEVDGELVVEPELFAKATIFSYYYYEDIDSTYPIMLEQEIELYLKVKPLQNPIIEYDGLVDYNDNNDISFDPYDDVNNYGGNLILPKDGLNVYFNNSLSDLHTFEARDMLRYYLLMADSEDIIKSHLFDSLINRTETSNTERIDVFKPFINEKIELYSQANELSLGQAGEDILAMSYDALLEGAQLNLEEREKQRKFLINFTTQLMNSSYELTPLMAWQKLMENNPNQTERANIVSHYLSNISSMTDDDILSDLSVMSLSYDSFIEDATNEEKDLILQNYILNMDDSTKIAIIDLLDDEGLYNSERDNISDTIIGEGGAPESPEIFDRLMNTISVDNCFGIMLLYEENKEYTKLVALATQISDLDAAKGLLFTHLANAAINSPTSIGILSMAMAAEIDQWQQAYSTEQRIWNFYVEATIENGIYPEILELIELYFSVSQNHTINRLKHITMNNLINVYDYNSQDMDEYFGIEDGDIIAYRFLQTTNLTIDDLLEDWQIIRAKSIVWDDITDNLTDESILTRILEGDADSTGRINTQPLRALAYERLKQNNEYLPIFETELLILEGEYSHIVDNQERRSTIFHELYNDASIENKTILILFLMGAAKAVSDSEQEILVVPYTQSGHNIAQITEHILELYLLLPDNQRIDITLNIFSRQIENALIPNVITNIEENQVLTTTEQIPNIYYIDPYNSETFRLPLQAEFEFETGYNLTLDINEWVNYDESVFYTRSPESQLQKIFYYNLNPESYKGGVYELESYLTYGIGEDVERQPFTITVIVLNRTLKEQYNEEHHFDNPISGRAQDIPSLLTSDMFVDYELYYKSEIEPEYYYGNFGSPVVPQIDWEKTALNENGIVDSDILVEGGFIKDVQGCLRYDNTMLFKTYNDLWQEVYEQYAQAAKPIAWEKFFEITYTGERIVKTIFAGDAALQIKSLDNDIFNEMYIEAYYKMYQEASADRIALIDYLMTTFRNNNFGLIPDQSSDLWYVEFYKDLSGKAYAGGLTDDEMEIWTVFNQEYENINDVSLNQKRAEKWDELFAMTGIWQGQQQAFASGYLDEAYENFRNSMLITTWDNLGNMVSQREYQVMSNLIDSLREIYSLEEAKVRAWDFLINDDRVISIIGESANVKVTAKQWNFTELMDMAENVINDITFNPFTLRANTEEFLANFEVLNTLLIDMLDDMLEDTRNEYMEEFKEEAMNLLKSKLMEKALEEVVRIDNGNSYLSGEQRNEANWDDLYQEKVDSATSPIDDTRADVDNETGGSLSTSERDEIVWSRLLEGAGEWLNIMTDIINDIDSQLEDRYTQAVDNYKEARIEVLTAEMNDIYEDIYRESSLEAWNEVAENPTSYGETSITVSQILSRDTKRNAWIALRDDYSDGTQISQMATHLDSNEIYGDLKFAYAWTSYYSSSGSSRKQLMDKLLLYYGFANYNSDFGAYGEVCNYVMDNPQSIGEDEETLLDIFDVVSQQVEDGYELVIVEFISRLHNYNPQAINDISQIFFNEIRRETWYYLLELREDDPELTALLPEIELKNKSWQRLWEIREQSAYDEYDVIDDIYEIIKEENFDNQLAMAYDKLDEIIINDVWLEKKDEILDNLNKDSIKLILWNRLYDSLESQLQTYMDATLNTVLREGGELGVDAEARAWDRFIVKNEISDDIKATMNEMYDTYMKARALEEYKDWYKQIVTEELDKTQDFLIESYKKSKVWKELYSQADIERKALMESILLNVYELYPDSDYEDEILEGFAFDDLVENEAITPAEKDAILIMLENTELEYENIQKINELKAIEWDYFYENATTSRKALMDDVYNQHATIINVINRKATSLDDDDFRNLLTATENNQLNARLEEGKQELLQQFFDARTYDELIKDPTYQGDLQDLYDFVYERDNILYNIEEPEEELIKVQALDLYYKQLSDNAQEEIDNFVAEQLESVNHEYKIELWDRYYEENLTQNPQRADMMLDILNDAIDMEINVIRLSSLEKLYENMKEMSTSKITAEREQLIDSIQKSQLWQQLFGEDISALKNILNDIMIVDDGQNLKNLAWDSLYEDVTTDQDSLDTMTSIYNNIYSENSNLSDFEIKALAFDYANNNYQDISQRLTEIVNEYKSQAWLELKEYFSEEEIMTNLFNEMFNLQMLYNDETESQAICWDRMIGMVFEIENSLAQIDPRFDEDQLRMFAVDVILDLLSSTERAVLENAANDIEISLTAEQIDAIIFDNIKESMAPTQKDILNQKYDEAQTLYPGAGEEALKHFALEMYLQHLESQATFDIDQISQDLFAKTFVELNEGQKLDVYENIYLPDENNILTVYTYELAQEYWEDAQVDSEYARMNIFWDPAIINEGGDIGNIYIGNAYKSYDSEDDVLNLDDNVFEGQDYIYRNRQIAIEYLDFYGELNIYADDEIIGTERYYNELVIDPLDPYIPNKVAAYGIINGITPDIEINGEMYSYIGMVDISYENRVYQYIYDDEDFSGEQITATVSPGMGVGEQQISINVYYLNRVPQTYYVNSQSYSNEQRDTELNLYPFSYDPVSGNNVMTIDPLNESIFNTATEQYILPNSIVVFFTDAYADGIISTLFMNDIFNNRLDMTGVQWDLLGNEISLSGLDPSNVTINQYTVGEQTIISTAAMNANFWKVQIEVTQRDVERILQVNAQGMGGELFATQENGMLQVSDKIDPYNVSLSFPDHVRVEFVGSGDIKLLNNIDWEFADGRGLEYLQQPQVITGDIGEAAMFLIAGFKVVSETIWINFPIQARHIDITVEGSDDIRPLEGGIIYLIKGQPVQEQLDRFSSLYYNFAEFGEEDDWSEVPLEFLANDVSQISTNEVGTYSIRGRLGPINDPNINFDVIVIDPKLYTEFEGETNNKVYFDRLSIAVNSYGVRVSGKEDEEGFLPDRFIQQPINDSAGDLVSGYDEFLIIDKQWDIANKEIRFTCVYTFLMDYHDVERLGGDTAASRELTFVITLPLDTYVYTEVDSSMTFDSSLNMSLGEELKMSDMPKAIMNKGEEDEFEVSLLWDLREINVNRAGTYYLYGYFRDYTSSHMARSKNIKVVIDRQDLSDDIQAQDALVQTYNGLSQVVTPIIPDVLRDNGIYTQLPLSSILVEYITEERYNMGDFGDFRTTPYKNSGVYYVRVTIDDYNVTGQKLFKLTVNPIEINPDDLSFNYGEGSSEISVPIPNWPQSEIEKERLFYDQFRIFADIELGINVENRTKAAALDTLYIALDEAESETGKTLIDNRINQILAEQFPEYEISDPQEQAAMLLTAKVIVWNQLAPIGFEDEALVDNWPQTEEEKEDLLDIARDELYEAGETEEEDLVKAQAYDNLYNTVVILAQDLLDNRFEFLVYDMYPNYNSMSDSMKTFITIEVKAIVWDEIISTGLEENPLIPEWPQTLEEKQDLLNEEYLDLYNETLTSEEKEMFDLQVKAMAYDELVLNVYSSAQEMLDNLLQSVIQQYFPLYDELTPEEKALILIEAKAIVWDEISPDDTVTERTYTYDGDTHMPDISGMPEVNIPNWPTTQAEKDELLNYAMNENANFTLEQAKARAFDNLQQTIFSNIYALQKMNDILDNVILSFYPQYHEPDTSFEERQSILIAAKARAWDTRIVPGDTVMEINYEFEFWYLDMENNEMIIETRPREAGTYEITLIVDPEANPNYYMREGEEVVITISVRRAEINQNFANQMTYTGKPILPRCEGLHDAQGNLPAGVSIEYNFWEDGEPVDYIRNVGEYTFSAVVNGGNNYPSWTIQEQTINIIPKEMSIEVGIVESDYLQPTKDFNSSIELYGIVGDDLPSMFGYLVCESQVTNKHMVGEYPINFVGFKNTYDSDKIYYIDAEFPEDDVMSLNATLFGNYNISIINGVYRINKAVQEAITIENEAQLHQRYGLLQEGDSETWYVAPGEYGDFEIDKNVGLTLIGSYDTSVPFGDFSHIEDTHDRNMEEVKDYSLSIATIFNSITVTRGAVTLDIVRFEGNINETSVYVGRNATSVEIKRSLFAHEEVLAPGGSPQPQNASAITTSSMFEGLLRLDRTYIEGFTIGVYMDGGQTLEVVNSRFNRNNAGLRANRGNIHIEGSRFEFTRGYAIYLEIPVFTTINCSLYSNEVGIASLSSASYDLWLENKFADNVQDVVTL